MKKFLQYFWIFAAALLFMLLLGTRTVAAAEAASEDSQIDIDELTKEINQSMGEEAPDFSKIYSYITKFKFKEVLILLGEWLADSFSKEILSSGRFVTQLVSILLFSILFTNVADSLKNYNIADNVFLISYFTLFLIIMSNFKLIHQIYDTTIINLSRFIKLMIPVYSLAISLTGNITTAALSYEYFMVVALLINYFAVNIISPLVNYYLILELVNHFSDVKRISRLCETIYLFISKGTKLLFFVIFGFHVLELMLVPAFDMSKHSVFNKLIGTIPGAGSAAQAVTGTILGSAIFIKNALGVSVMIFLFVLMIIPILKIALYSLMYLIISIILEPICDQKFIGCISAVQKSGWLYVKLLGLCSVLFLVSVALCAVSTNQL